MKSVWIGILLAASLLTIAQSLASTEPVNPAPAPQGSDIPDDIVVEGKWPADPRRSGSGPMPRHYMVVLWGVPAPYAGMANPLRRRKDVLDRGLAIYKDFCAVCHGEGGAGNGLGGRSLKPPPGNLVWLSDVPEKQWDEFMYWTIAEGGTALGTSMPPYKQLLTQDEIWSVTAYIQENIPFVSRMR